MSKGEKEYEESERNTQDSRPGYYREYKNITEKIAVEMRQNKRVWNWNWPLGLLASLLAGGIKLQRMHTCL